jgi:hypothetical protein
MLDESELWNESHELQQAGGRMLTPSNSACCRSGSGMAAARDQSAGVARRVKTAANGSATGPNSRVRPESNSYPAAYTCPRRASIAAHTRPCSLEPAAIAARLEKANSSAPVAARIPFASAAAIRTPVNDPGPEPTTTRPMSAGVYPVDSTRRSISGRTDSEWTAWTESRDSAWTLPSSPSAMLPVGVEVSSPSVSMAPPAGRAAVVPHRRTESTPREWPAAQ